MFRKILRQGLLIVLLAVIFSVVTNHLREDPLPWIARDSEDPSNYVTLEESRNMYFSGTAFFIDARPYELFVQGHIKNAICLSYKEFEQFEGVLMKIPIDMAIITYCDGVGCSLSKELASLLRLKGYTRVATLADGWRLWQQNQLPVEEGDNLHLQTVAFDPEERR